MTALLIFAVLCFGAAAGLFLAVQICAKKRRTARRSDCLIVLGAKVHPDGRLSHALQFRCDAAEAAFRNGVAPVVIACGGRGGQEPTAEALAIRTELTRRGVPERAILTDATSKDTRENLVNAKALMAAHGFRGCAIVTSDYHMQRALWLARDLGMDACGVPSQTARGGRRFFKTRIRESISWIKYAIQK